MKKLLMLSLLVASQIVSANCNLRTASILENEHKVGPVNGLAKRFSAEVGRCAVSYQINVDGEDHLVVYSADGSEREDVLCGYAIERGRRELLLTLGGQFKTQANLVCEEGKAVKQKIQIGDSILENEVGMNAKLNFYWPHKQYAKCRMFKEHYVQNKAPVEYNGVICQNNTNDLWTVVDKW